MTYNKITTYIALPVFAFSAFAISVIAVSPQASAVTASGNGNGGARPQEPTPAQKEAAAAKAKAAKEAKANEAKAAKEAKIAAAKARTEERKKQIRTSYTQCLEGMKDYKNTTTLQKLNDKILQDRAGRIKDISAKVAKMNDGERKTKLEGYLKADQASLEAIHASSKGSTDTAVLQKTYCEAIWKLQINQFRAKQVAYVSYAQRQFTAQEKLLTAVNTAITNTTAGTNPAKTFSLEQLNAAKTTLTAAISANRAVAASAMNAKVTMDGGEYVNNLEKPADYPVKNAVKKMSAFQSALLDYTESVVARKTGNQYDRNLVNKLEVKSVTLKDQNGNKLNVQRKLPDNPDTKKDESGRTINYRAASARTAVVEVRVNGKDYTKTLVRDSPVGTWKISNPKPNEE